MSGADLANLVNEAALLATRDDKAAVDMKALDAAFDKVILGAKREEVITEKDKRATAYHEVGHALVAWLPPKADPVHKVTILPMGMALGVTQQLPQEDKHSYDQNYLEESIVVAMGGRIGGGVGHRKLLVAGLSHGGADGTSAAARAGDRVASRGTGKATRRGRQAAARSSAGAKGSIVTSGPSKTQNEPCGTSSQPVWSPSSGSDTTAQPCRLSDQR